MSRLHVVLPARNLDACRRRVWFVQDGQDDHAHGGDVASLTSPIGMAVVFLAQGVAITLFRSLLRHISIAGLDHRTTLVHVGHGHPFRADTEPEATVVHYPS